MLKDVHFRHSYSSGYDEPKEFFTEALIESSTFDLGLGFFSSSGIRSLAYGFALFVGHGVGHIDGNSAHHRAVRTRSDVLDGLRNPGLHGNAAVLHGAKSCEVEMENAAVGTVEGGEISGGAVVQTEVGEDSRVADDAVGDNGVAAFLRSGENVGKDGLFGSSKRSVIRNRHCFSRYSDQEGKQERQAQKNYDGVFHGQLCRYARISSSLRAISQIWHSCTVALMPPLKTPSP